MKSEILLGYQRINDEVYYAPKSPFVVTQIHLAELCVIAEKNPSGKARICCHTSALDLLHDMFIALNRKAEIKPHSHRYKAESFQVIEGALNVLIFDISGKHTQSIELAAPDSNGVVRGSTTFYCHIPAGLIHTVVPQTESVVFREVTNGPFRPEDTVYPEWIGQERSR